MIPLRDTVPHRYPPVVTTTLIVLNGLVFFGELSLPPAKLKALFYLFGIVPARYSHPEWAVWFGFPVDNYWPFVTTMFLHGGWLHIVGNMWSLWLFGDNVEDRMGHLGFLAFYLLCGLAAGMTHVALNPHSTLPTIGASGAIAGVMGAYLLLFPRAQIAVLVPIFFFIDIWVVPAVFFLGFWFFIQLYSGAIAIGAPGSFGGVAVWAHVGGFVVGMVLMPVFVSLRKTYRRWYPDESIHDYPHHFFWN